MAAHADVWINIQVKIYKDENEQRGRPTDRYELCKSWASSDDTVTGGLNYRVSHPQDARNYQALRPQNL